MLDVRSYIGYQETIQLRAAVAHIATTPSTTITAGTSAIETTAEMPANARLCQARQMEEGFRTKCN